MSKNIEKVERSDFLLEKCRGKKVLHLGCTNYPYTENSLKDNSLLHIKLDEISSELYGFDFDQKGIDILKEKGFKNLYQADLENLQAVDLNQTFDVIIAGEMIEHLSNPGLFLDGIQRFMNPQTSLIITTINAYCAMRYAIYALRGRGGISEPVHPDHVAYYSYATLNLVIKRSGLDVRNFLFYDLGAEHRPYSPWYWNLVNDISVKFFPQLCDGIIAECHLK